MLIPIESSNILVNQSIMNNALSDRVSGKLVFLEIWGYIPTVCFMTNDGACYHDIPLQMLGTKFYHTQVNGLRWNGCWDVAKEPDDRPQYFKPPKDTAWLYGKDREPIGCFRVLAGLVWEKGDVLLYLCQRDNDLYLWPVHKMMFAVGWSQEAPKLPNWGRNRIAS